MNTAGAKPWHGLTSAERTREERRIGSGQRSRERTPFLSQERVYLLGFGGKHLQGECKELRFGWTWVAG